MLRLLRLDQLPQEDRRELARHLHDCESCRELDSAGTGGMAQALRARRHTEAERLAIRRALSRSGARARASKPAWTQPSVLARIALPLALLALLRHALESVEPGAATLEAVRGEVFVGGHPLGEGTAHPVTGPVALTTGPAGLAVLQAGEMRVEAKEQASISLEEGEPRVVHIDEGVVVAQGPCRLRTPTCTIVLEAGDEVRVVVDPHGVQVDGIRGSGLALSALEETVILPGEHLSVTP